jgi:hypothetical protein
MALADVPGSIDKSTGVATGPRSGMGLCTQKKAAAAKAKASTTKITKTLNKPLITRNP